MPPLADLSRLSLNQITTERWNVREAIAGCARHNIPAIGLWRHKIAECNLHECAQMVRDAGLVVSSVCRGGMFPAATAAERRVRIDDNLRAIDEAAALGARVLVLVCGAAPDRDLDGARAVVADGIAHITAYARACGVRLGIEPLHPMFAAERSVVTTLAEARALAAQHELATVGVVVDVYHVWWDPMLYDEIKALGERICGFHVSDWLVPLPDPLMGRGMMGDGVIELRRIRCAVEAAGYRGPIEVEIFNKEIWECDGDAVLKTMCERYLMTV